MQTNNHTRTRTHANARTHVNIALSIVKLAQFWQYILLRLSCFSCLSINILQDLNPRPIKHSDINIIEMGLNTLGCMSKSSVIHEKAILFWEPLTKLRQMFIYRISSIILLYFTIVYLTVPKIETTTTPSPWQGILFVLSDSQVVLL